MSGGAKLLIVDDEPAIRRLIGAALSRAGYRVIEAGSAREALTALQIDKPELVLLDLGLPDRDGLELVQPIKAAGAAVIVVSARDETAEKVAALDLGADDYITKPFDKAELIARMQAIVRRSKGFSQPTLRIGSLQLNLDSREVLVAGHQVHLTGKEYAILELLVLRKGMVLTKEAFLNHLYGGMDEPEMKIIDVFICKLRKKLAQAGADALIGTVWGRGYMLREPSSDGARSAAIHPTGEPTPLPGPSIAAALA